MTARNMTAITEVAETLVGQFGTRAMIYVDHQVSAALDHGDWHNVKAWRLVGADVEKLLSQRVFAAHVGASRSIH